MRVRCDARVCCTAYPYRKIVEGYIDEREEEFQDAGEVDQLAVTAGLNRGLRLVKDTENSVSVERFTLFKFLSSDT